MFIEYKDGEKHTGKIDKAELSEDITTFNSCGELIADNEVVIDIDHLPKASIKAMIQEFGIKTQVVWTERGAHLWFKKPVWFTRRHDGVCKLAFEIEQHTMQSNPGGMTVRRNGVTRDIDNIGLRAYMPDIFQVGTKKKPYQNLTGMDDGDGRNKALFAHRKALSNCQDWQKMLGFINKHVFTTPLTDEEFGTILRDISDDADTDDKYWIASEIIQKCRTVFFSGMIWWRKDGEYIADEDNRRLIRRVYELCEGQTSRYVDEIVKQIQYRSPLIDGEAVFPIRFNNGVLQEGMFIPMKDYTDFTPFMIDVDYKEDAAPVQEVDDYIDSLTSKDPDYRMLLMEVIGFVMITDPERIRSLGKFFMFRGDGANGKGTLLQIMKRIYNPKNCTSLSIKQLVDDRFKVTMVGKLANLGDDIEAEAITHDELKVLKNISTADTVSTRKLYEESENATFTVKLYFTTNSDILSFDKGYAFKRRIQWLPMFNKVDKPDPYFITKMTTKPALEYWIRLIVEGYKRLYQNRKWTVCKVVEDYNNQYHEDNNVCLMYAKDLDPNTEIIGKTITQIRMDFMEWTSDDRKFSSKLFQDAVWDLYKIGLGRSKQNGKTRRVFMRQKDTNQKLHN